MKIQVKQLNVSRDINRDIIISLTVDNHYESAVSDFKKDTLYDAEIKKRAKKRSLNANSYMWVLCDKLAQKVGGTKEDIYRKAIRDVGVFEDVPIHQDAVERWKHSWEAKGEGWVCEISRESKLEGYTVTRNYYGSSVYDSREMARLIDYIVEDAKDQGIPTDPPDVIAHLIDLWEKENVYLHDPGNPGQ